MRKVLLPVLVNLLIPYLYARPLDQEESKRASKFRRLVTGLEMVTDVVLSMTNPSRLQAENASPTKIQVFFAGLGRTGTTSLASAMTVLGYRVLHDDEAAAVMDLYEDFFSGTISEDQLFQKIGERGFNCSFMYNDYEWAAKQKDVKIVLNGRDPERWVDSFLAIADTYDIFASRPFTWSPTIKTALPMLYDQIKVLPTGGHPEKYNDREALLAGYEIHYDNVRAAVPPERLLDYSVTEGWGPLCEFLGVPVPNEPFPHLNDRFKIQVVIFALSVITWIWPLLVALPVLALLKLVKYLSGGAAGKMKSS